MSEHSAGTDLSTTTSVDYSLSESSLPHDVEFARTETTVSLTASALSTTYGESDESKITAHMIEKKQLLHELDRLRIELSQKTLLLETYKAELLNKIDELEEKLADITYSKHMLKARLESQLKLKEDETKTQQMRLKEELSAIVKRQQNLEEENLRLQQKAGDLKLGLFDSRLTEEQYVDLKSNDINQLSLKEYVAVHFFEATQSLKIQCESLQQRVDVLTEELVSRDEEVASHQKEVECERQARAEHAFMTQKLSLQVQELKSKLQNKDFKSQHYDEVVCDRQDFEREIMELRKNNVVLETSHHSKTKENTEITKEMASCKQSLALVKQDKEYLSNQLAELTTRSKIYEEQVTVLSKELARIKQTREELYEKYISIREKYKSEYEMRLKDELDEITSKTNSELEKIKNNTKEMYEMENRNLREARDNALAEKDRAIHGEQNMTSRYEQVFQEYRQLQTASDSGITELQSDLKVKQFELHRLQMLYEESSQRLKQVNVENAKYQNKLEVLNKEFYALQASTDKHINELQSKSSDAIKKLTIYEKLEQELDDVILQAAELESEVDAERILFSYGYGANVPSTAKRRMQQSVHLARRVLKLERANTSLQGQLDLETKKRDQLMEELTNTTNILNEAQQPYNSLIESIRVRDSRNKSLREHNSLLEEDVRRLQEERDKLGESKNQITADLERLLNQREELGLMKKVILNLKSQGREPSPRPAQNSSTSFQSLRPNTKKSMKNDSPHSVPAPTQFTKPETPLWYNKLKPKQSRKT